LAYVKNFGIYNWYFGSGEYLDTATKTTQGFLLAMLNQIGKGQSDYFFVINTKGDLLMNDARQDLEGKNMAKSSNPDLSQLYLDVFEAANSQSTDFISYPWLNPKTGSIETKFTYVKRVKGSDWIIGSGFYPLNLDKEYQVHINRVNTLYQQDADRLTSLSWLGAVIALLIASVISIIVSRLLSRYQQDLITSNDELTDLNLDLENKLLDQAQFLKQQNEQLKDLVRTDSLTNVANRYSMMQKLSEELERAERFGEQFTIIILDIDLFKQVNDSYGYDEADLVLEEFASIVQAELRSVDFFGRLGGEEFLIVMPNTSIRPAKESAERIRQTVQEHVFKESIRFTISLGLSEYRKGETASNLLSLADMALLEAKESGRNCVCVS